MDWLAGIDASVEAWFGSHRSPREKLDARTIFRFIGEPTYVASAAVVCGGLLAMQARSVVRAALVIGAVAVGVVVEQALKATVTRTATVVAEQQDKPIAAYQNTFPSGHVTGSAALLGTIAVCLGAECNRTLKALLAGLVVAAVLFVGYLTLYVRAHTFSDVIGGMFLGGALVALSAALLGASEARVTRDRAADSPGQ